MNFWDTFSVVYLVFISALALAGPIAWYGLAAGWWERPWETWEEYQAKKKKYGWK